MIFKGIQESFQGNKVVKVFLNETTKTSPIPNELDSSSTFGLCFRGNVMVYMILKTHHKSFRDLDWLRQKESNVLDILEYFMPFPSSGHNSFRSLISNAISQRQS